jgi:hypothetical protein
MECPATNLDTQFVNTLRDSRHDRDFLHLALVVEAAHLGRVSQKIIGGEHGGCCRMNLRH